MAQFVASRTLADALNAAQSRLQNHASLETAAKADPMVDRLATALAVTQPGAADFDDGDEDLDLPMLVQGERFGALVPSPAEQRAREGRAALIGFALGLVLLVPIGIVMSERLPGFSTPTPTSRAAIEVQSAIVPAASDDSSALLRLPATDQALATDDVKALQLRETPAEPAPASRTVVAGVSRPAIAIAAPESPDPAPLKPATRELEQARSKIAAGDIEGARKILKELVGEANPAAVMMLAETFDPNMLAAWSARGAAADADLARTLYRSALAMGLIRAQQRLDALE